MTRVLIVDDSPTETHVLKGMLEKHGYQVDIATTGEDGMRLAQEQTPDVILMDIVMPGVNGFQATRKLSKDPATSGIPIVMISTKDQDTDRIWAKRQGAKDYITKPVTEDELLEKIKNALEG
ncbi:two-component system response regulator [Alkalilimnicola ehrlichii]|uniref:Two-component system response regulator n=1 Tax=Alkalilimnicola ehrlichii TaxID=351052 RepID=A0A3E0X1I0_9GAMM|nr:response regulator [Alkalilimnicola ehrlichii]RFA31210.1 two-component system response regulator [Alkalilimnicola ehrlichii]RFA39509.1 two-component system response regulator [Alkalilimnicola ehrlichii]